MAARYPPTPSISSSLFSPGNRSTLLLGMLASALFIYIIFFDSAFRSLNESQISDAVNGGNSGSVSQTEAKQGNENSDIDLEKYSDIIKEIEKSKREKINTIKNNVEKSDESIDNNKKTNTKPVIRVVINENELNEIGNQQPTKSDQSVHPWVLKYGVSHLFDWTWKRNGDYQRYQERMREPAHDSFHPDSPQTVNDVREFLHSHPEEGILVDDFEQLKNPVPHPLPRTAQSTNHQELCRRLNLRPSWLACRMDAVALSTSEPWTTRFVNAAFFDAFVDSGSCNDVVPGTVFTNRRTFHFQRWTGNDCYNNPIHHIRGSIEKFDEIADSVGTYTSAIGHFPVQQLPRLIRMAATAPNTTKLLTATGGICDGFLDVLVNRGVIQREQIVPWSGRKVYYGKTVFRSESWPYLSGEKYNHYLHDRTDMELMHKVFVDDVSPEERNKLIIIRRRPNGGRDIKNHDNVVKMLEKYAEGTGLEVTIFEATGHLQSHIDLFKRARLVVGPHGAGFVNLMWCAPGTHAIEVGYNSGMTLPSMYFEVATHNSLEYWLVFGEGDYSGSIQADEAELDDIFRTAIAEIQQKRQEEGIL